MRFPSLKKILKDAVKILAATLVLLLFVEGAIRVVYAIRNARVEVVPIPYMVRNFGLVAPWMDSLRILEPDDELMWKGRPHVHRKYMDVFSPARTQDERVALLSRFNPGIPDWLRGNHVWEFSLNSDGFRDEDFPAVKAPNTLRILCLGDSWTFGANVNQDESYPSRLRAMLKKDFPAARIEVFNLGMLAYTSYQGLELLKRRALALQPDIVIIGYAMNDASISGWRDKDLAQAGAPRFKLKKFFAAHMESYKLAAYLAQVSRFDQISMSEHLKAMNDPARRLETYEGWESAEFLEAADYAQLEAKTRVSPQDYEKNVRAMVALIREHQASPILLHNEIRPGSPYQAALRKLSIEERVPLVDSTDIIAQAKQQLAQQLTERLGLQQSGVAAKRSDNTSTVRGVEVVFRLYAGEQLVQRALYITGPHKELGDAVPNRIAMYDDGTHGDERAGDRVWTYTARFAPGQKIFYVYTNSGSEGLWEGLDVPKIRSFNVPDKEGARVYKPLESFGEIYMQADGWHTTAAGLDRIARAIKETVEQHETFRARIK